MKSTIQYIKKKKPWADFSVPALVLVLREPLAATPRAARCRTTCARTDKGRFIHPHNRRLLTQLAPNSAGTSRSNEIH